MVLVEAMVGTQQIMIGGKPLDWEKISESQSQAWNIDSPSCFLLKGSHGINCRLLAKASNIALELTPVDGTPLYFRANVFYDPEVERTVMEATVFLKLPKYPGITAENERIEGFPSGSELLRSAWDFFRNRYPDLSGIKARFEKPQDISERSDNYDAYTKGRNSGLSKEEAARFTWSGNQAQIILGENMECRVIDPFVPAKDPTVMAYFLAPKMA